MHRRVHALLPAACLLSACATSAPPEAKPGGELAQLYAIRLHQPAEIGARQLQSSTLQARQTLVVRSGERVLHERRDELQLALRAEVEVLDVTDDGTPRALRYRVEDFTQTTPDGPQSLLAPGTAFIVTRGAETPFNVVEGQMSQEVQDYLGLLIPTHAPSANDDQLLGTDAPQPVGGTWPIDSQRAAAELETAGLRIAPQALTGQSRLVGVSAVDGVAYLEVRTELQATEVLPPRLPPGASLRRSQLNASFSGLFPADARGPRLQDGAELSAEVVFEQTLDGQPVESQMRLEQQSRTSYAPAPAAS